MKQIYVISAGLLTLLLTVAGCTSKNEALSSMEKELMSEKPLTLYTAPTEGVYLADRWKHANLFKAFPFVAPLAPFDFTGKFPSNFYDDMNLSVRSVGLEKVDWAALSVDPSIYDVIYVQPFGIAEAGSFENDFALNVGRAYNVAPENMKRLKNWIEQGGVLWSEAGITASRFETFYPHGGINDAKTSAMFTRDYGLFFGLPVSYRNLKSMSVDMVNYETVPHLLHPPMSVTQLKEVKNVYFKPAAFIESYPILRSEPLLIDGGGTLYGSYAVLGKGMVLTMVPSAYWHAEDDGELLRWKLLQWIDERLGRTEGSKKANQ